MSEKEYFKSINNLIRKSDIKIKQKEKNIAKKIIQRWNKIWPFVGREIELKMECFFICWLIIKVNFFALQVCHLGLIEKICFLSKLPFPKGQHGQIRNSQEF